MRTQRPLISSRGRRQLDPITASSGLACREPVELALTQFIQIFLGFMFVPSLFPALARSFARPLPWPAT